MADSLFDEIGKMVGGTLTPEIAEALKGLPGNVEGVMAESLGHIMDSMPVESVLEGIQVNLSAPSGDAATSPVDATAEPAPFTLPAGADLSELQGHMEGVADRLQALGNEGLARMSSADPDEQAHGQLLMQQSQALMEAVQSVLQNMNSDTIDAIQNLHSNTDAGHDAQGTVVAMADSGDGHVVGHAEPDAVVDHPIDHSGAPPAHDDGAATDPSAVA